MARNTTPKTPDAEPALWEVVVDHDATPGDVLGPLADLLLDLLERDGTAAGKHSNPPDRREFDRGDTVK